MGSGGKGCLKMSPMVDLLEHWHAKDQRAGFTKMLPKRHTHFNTLSVHLRPKAGFSLCWTENYLLKNACYKTLESLFLPASS